MRNRRRDSDPQCSLCCNQQRENGHSKHGTMVVYEVEESDSVGDETIEAIAEIRKGYRRHGGSVRSA